MGSLWRCGDQKNTAGAKLSGAAMLWLRWHECLGVVGLGQCNTRASLASRTLVKRVPYGRGGDRPGRECRCPDLIDWRAAFLPVA
ncbi:MAG: hypothetical protein K0U93_20165, partial [Gammaproteobacteria bacterium]|nr:hypothetical protein [Gammaproteobacteria bacterium]